MAVYIYILDSHGCIKILNDSIIQIPTPILFISSII